MKYTKHRFQGYVYFNTDKGIGELQAELNSKLPELGFNGVYLQDMNELRDKQYFQKIDGKYHPLRSDYDTWGMSKGSYLMEIKPGSTSYVSMVKNPARLEVEAALNEFKDELAKLIVEAQSCRPSLPMTKRQAKLWEKWNKEVGKDFFRTLTIESAADTIDKLVEFVRQKMKTHDTENETK
jgi:hypothetical protein